MPAAIQLYMTIVRATDDGGGGGSGGGDDDDDGDDDDGGGDDDDDDSSMVTMFQVNGLQLQYKLHMTNGEEGDLWHYEFSADEFCELPNQKISA